MNNNSRAMVLLIAKLRQALPVPPEGDLFVPGLFVEGLFVAGMFVVEP